jgi:hypothetical protein
LTQIPANPDLPVRRVDGTIPRASKNGCRIAARTANTSNLELIKKLDAVITALDKEEGAE